MAADPDLRERLREWRRAIAKEQGVAAFVVLHDTTMDEICRRQPSSTAALLSVPGIGEKKLERYGRQIL
ncbi:MAG: HRDC domain-containing protein, partial [Candidatus Acidiferrales bacterium]